MNTKKDKLEEDASSTGDSMTDQQPSLLCLDDDCLILILEKVNVLKQFQMSCMNMRLREVVRSLWRTTHLSTIFLCDEMLADVNDEEFMEFMLTVKPCVENIIAKGLKINRFRLLTDSEFPKIQSFHFDGKSNEENDAEEESELGCVTSASNQNFQDEDVLLLQRIVPNLRVLKLKNCQITGKYICELSKLKHLSLDTCQNLESENFRDIFHKLHLHKFDVMRDCDEINCCDLVEIKKCSTLQHIKIADYHLCFDVDIVTDLLRMPNLQKVSIYSNNFIFDVIERVCKQSSKPIVGFQFIGSLPDYSTFFAKFSLMRKLKKLFIFEVKDTEVCSSPVIYDHTLLEISKQLIDLEDLHLCGCMLESCKGLLHFISNCRHLQSIHLNDSKGIDSNFICQSLDLLKKQKWRTKPLVLRLRGTNINIKQIKQSPHYIHNTRFLSIEGSKEQQQKSPQHGILKFFFSAHAAM